MFADDTNLFISGKDLNTLNHDCNYCTDALTLQTVDGTSMNEECEVVMVDHQVCAVRF